MRGWSSQPFRDGFDSLRSSFRNSPTAIVFLSAQARWVGVSNPKAPPPNVARSQRELRIDGLLPVIV
jgi:hypothetical protein